MTTWYVTTGVSLWEQSRCWQLEDVNEDVFQQADQQGVSELQQSEEGRQLLALWAQKRGTLKASLAANPRRATELVEQNFRRECWDQGRLRTLPAELTTLYLLFRGQNEHQIGEEDKIIFLAGGSNHEVGYVLQAILRCVGCNNPTDVWECGNLDPSDDQQFNQAMAALAARIETFTNAFRLVLTGGYKGVLIALARRFSHVPVYYNHERTPNVLICFQGLQAQRIEPPID